MAMSAWFCDVATGEVVCPAPLARGSRFSAALGGGSFTASINLARFTTRDGLPDRTVVDPLLAYCEGGRYTLLLVDGSEVLGEWLIWKSPRPSTDGVLSFSGFEWDAYPAYRVNHNYYRYRDGIDLGLVLYEVLNDCYVRYQPGGIRFTIPRAKQSITVELEREKRVCYYRDILDELDKTDPGVEWRVGITSSWGGGTPTRVTRTIKYAKPEFATASGHVLVKPPLGRRGGNVVDFTRSTDYSRIARSVYAWGNGEGGKQRYGEAHDETTTDAGYIAITKTIQVSGALSKKQLDARARQEVRLSQSAWEPSEATVDMRAMRSHPKIGDVVTFDIGSSWATPAGYRGRERVGQIDYTIGSPLIGVKTAEVN